MGARNASLDEKGDPLPLFVGDPGFPGIMRSEKMCRVRLQQNFSELKKDEAVHLHEVNPFLRILFILASMSYIVQNRRNTM